MNIRLLRRIQKAILREPRRLNMGKWIDDYSLPFKPPCGTAACIAGHAEILSLGRMDFASAGKRLIRKRHSFFETHGRELLDLGDGEGSRLFFTDNWPERYREAYEAAHYAGHAKKAARITVNRINHFIKTKGAE